MQYAVVYLEPSQTSMMKFLCENNERLEAAYYLRKKAP